MIICGKCGNDNPLGRVFCGKCGGKLDFSHTSSQEMAVKTHESWLGSNWKKIVGVLVLIVLIPVALLLWPQSSAVGKQGGGGETRVENGVKAVAGVVKGQIVNATFAEEDLNSYLQLIKAKAAGADSLSIAVMKEGYFIVRLVHPLFELPVLKTKAGPVVMKLSCDIVCVPDATGGVIVSKATIGHLPALGPFKTRAARMVHGAVLKDKDWAPFMNITDIKVADGRITVTIKP